MSLLASRPFAATAAVLVVIHLLLLALDVAELRTRAAADWEGMSGLGYVGLAMVALFVFVILLPMAVFGFSLPLAVFDLAGLFWATARSPVPEYGNDGILITMAVLFGLGTVTAGALQGLAISRWRRARLDPPDDVRAA